MVVLSLDQVLFSLSIPVQRFIAKLTRKLTVTGLTLHPGFDHTSVKTGEESVDDAVRFLRNNK